METALSSVTNSYIRTDDILGAVQENLMYIKPPLREIFQGFVGDAMMISSDTKNALRNLREKIDNDIFREWCDTLVFSMPGKIVLALCGTVILVTAGFMLRFTRPVEYKR